MTYEIIEHTADFGIRVFGKTKEELFQEAAFAMFDNIAENLHEVQLKEKINVELKEINETELLIRWLAELFFYFDTERKLFRVFTVQLKAGALQGIAYGEIFDPIRHTLRLDIKSVTYHGAYLEKTQDGYQAQVIFDI